MAIRDSKDRKVSLLPTPPTGSPSWITAELLELTIVTWQPYYQTPLTPEDAVAIIRNVSTLMDVLSRG